MSGYLQRMVASVRTPERRVHPIVGSLYSAPEFAAPETFEAEEVLVASTAPRLVPEPVPQSPQTFEPRKPPTPAPARNDAQAGSDSVETPAMPLPSPNRQAAADPPALSYSRVQAPHIPAPQPIAPTPWPQQDAAPEAESFPPRSYSPLLSETRPLSASQGPLRHASALTAQPRGTRPVLPGRSHQPSAPQHDEIEIHIGRIEVTAVQPAAPRAPAPPVRKALNLDEYLKRGSRR
jgi:hypothetical protein